MVDGRWGDAERAGELPDAGSPAPASNWRRVSAAISAGVQVRVAPAGHAGHRATPSWPERGEGRYRTLIGTLPNSGRYLHEVGANGCSAADALQVAAVQVR